MRIQNRDPKSIAILEGIKLLVVLVGLSLSSGVSADTITVSCPDHWPGLTEKGTTLDGVEWRDRLGTNQPPFEGVISGRTSIDRSDYGRLKDNRPIYLICSYSNRLQAIFRFVEPVGVCENRYLWHDEPLDFRDYRVVLGRCVIEVTDREAFERRKPYLTEPINLQTTIEGFGLRKDRAAILKQASDEGWIIDGAGGLQPSASAEFLRLKRGVRQIDIKFAAKSGLSREIVEYNPVAGNDDGVFYERIFFRFGRDDMGAANWERDGIRARFFENERAVPRRQSFHLIDMAAE